MAVAFKIRVSYLRLKLLAHTFIFRELRKPTGAVTILFFKSAPDIFYDFFVFVKSYSHVRHSLLCAFCKPFFLFAALLYTRFPIISVTFVT